MAGSTGTVGNMPSACMGARQPMHPIRDFLNSIAQNNEMPVIWHYAVCDYLDRVLGEPRSSNIEESVKVAGRFEDCGATNRAIHYVERRTLEGVAKPSGHIWPPLIAIHQRKAGASS